MPRVAALALLGAVTASTAWLEGSGALALVRRVFWPWEGRLRILPAGGFRADVPSVGGVHIATDLLFGPRHRAGLTAWAAAGAPRLWGAGAAIHLLGLSLAGRPPPPGRLRLSLAGAYWQRDDVPFRGAGYRRADGAGAPPAARYGERRATAVARLQARLVSHLWLAAHAGFERRRLEDGRAGGAALPLSLATDYATELDALGRDVDAARLDLALRWGVVGHLGPPAAGVRARVQATLWLGRDAALPLLGWQADLEAFSSLLGPWRRLGLRARVAARHGFGRAAVPLPYLPRLGGLETLRGFSDSRFQGESLAWLSLEYWFALHPRLWMALLGEVGAAGREHFSGWDWGRIDGCGGGRMTLRVAPGYWLMLQVAGSREGATLWIGMRARPADTASGAPVWRRER